MAGRGESASHRVIVAEGGARSLTFRDRGYTFWDRPATADEPVPFSQVRSACLTNYAEVARSLRLDPFAQLRDAGLDARCLTNPDLKIPVVRVHALLEASAAAAGVEDFGLRMAMTRRMSNLGLIALAAREEPTVRDALLCLQRTMRLHNETIRLDIEEANGVAVLRERFPTRVEGGMRQGVELSIGVLYRVVSEFLGNAGAPLTVCFMHSPPQDARSYRKAFACSVQFNSVLNGITCKSRDLDRAMPMADPQSLRTIRQYLDRATEHQPTCRERTIHLILELLPSGRCSADLVAHYMGVDRRTLHRRLQTEGTSFSVLTDEVRQEAARRHIHSMQHSLGELGSMLGFSDASAFSRWFSAKFGCPPRRWQREHAEAN
jgi:AraC-like DNA-binding protein